ncbi:hypothetical protein EDD86DRAFT_214843 [Gorgonomyces haynaldii]|nr:hypothetical protein EDD86DRAFT_214843 [Gorgonomyces haynaldii]
MFFQTVLAYNLPAAFPSTDQLNFITGKFLQDPIVTDAMKIVQQKVPASILGLKPSIYRPATPESPKYVEDGTKTCYWPLNQCIQSSNPSIKPDFATCAGQSQWGLTFDDGPTVNLVNGKNVDDSVALQQVLKQAGVKATFFIVGSNAIQFPEVVKAHLDDGHELALHSWTHHPMTSLTNEQIVAELKYNEAIIFKAAGVIPRFFRPPYGDIDDRVRAIAQALGYEIAIWNKDSEDASQSDTSEANAVKVAGKMKQLFQTTDSIITLEHDISTFTTNVAIKIFTGFTQAQSKLKVMPVAQCVNQQPYINDNPSQTTAVQTTVAQTSAVQTSVVQSTAAQTSAIVQTSAQTLIQTSVQSATVTSAPAITSTIVLTTNGAVVTTDVVISSPVLYPQPSSATVGGYGAPSTLPTILSSASASSFILAIVTFLLQ